MKTNVIKLLLLTSLFVISIWCTGMAPMPKIIACYKDKPKPCTCGVYPMMASSMMCSAGIWHSGWSVPYCVWSAPSPIPDKPWVEVVAPPQGQQSYTNGTTTCSFLCTHTWHGTTCPQNFGYVRGKYDCTDPIHGASGASCTNCCGT